MLQSRLSVQTDFPNDTKVDARILYIQGQPEWVDNYLTFGDLIEAQMGKDARDFYFETVHSLLSDIAYLNDTEEDVKEAEGVRINVTPAPPKDTKQHKTGVRRLF